MKQFKKILKFELANYYKSKAFVGITVFLVAAIAVVMYIPRIADAIKKNNEQTAESVMYIKTESKEFSNALESAFTELFKDYEIKITDENTESIKEKIVNEDIECAFVFNKDLEYKYYVNNLSLSDHNTAVANEALQNILSMNAMLQMGISPENAAQVMSVPVVGEVETLGKDQIKNYWYTYIMIFALYMCILLYGQMVAMNVATEKSSRAMELLVTTAKPTSMMFGKVLSSCIAGLIQLTLVFGSAIFFFNLNKKYWGEDSIINLMFDIPPELLIYMLVFFILGFLIYAFIYGAVGSTVSKLEDIGSSATPIQFLFIAAFLIVLFSMPSGNIDSILMRVCSYIPFTSPMAMFARIAMSTVPTYEIIISIAILIASVIGTGILSAKIYRVGVLLYGTKPKLGELLKAIKKA